jgi:hypothetical protein
MTATSPVIRTNSIGADTDLMQAVAYARNNRSAGIDKAAMCAAMDSISPMLSWQELSSSERTLLRFVYESAWKMPVPDSMRMTYG